MTTDADVIAELDQWFPPAGPCGLCGHRDKRHRLWDALLGFGDSAVDLAREYDLPLEAVDAVRRIRPYAHQRRPRRATHR